MKKYAKKKITYLPLSENHPDESLGKFRLLRTKGKAKSKTKYISEARMFQEMFKGVEFFVFIIQVHTTP